MSTLPDLQNVTAPPEMHHDHQNVTGGWLRPAVFGAKDGLVSNFALIAGVAGGGVASNTVALAGLTGLVAGVPLILVIYAMGFGLPALNLEVISTQDPVVYGVAALVLCYAAYVSEVYRAGIDSVHPSQAAAARSLGLSEWQALRFVVIPQAVRRIVPPLLNDFISLQKDTALVAVLGVIEANRAAGIYSSTVFNYSGYTVAALLFLVLTVPLARFTDYLVARDRRQRHGEVAA